MVMGGETTSDDYLQLKFLNLRVHYCDRERQLYGDAVLCVRGFSDYTKEETGVSHSMEGETRYRLVVIRCV